MIFLASAAIILAPECQAGTGGIFSSSTSPRRKIPTIQSIESPTSLPRNVSKPSSSIPPTPGTVFFDAKKSARPDGALNADTQMHELQQTLSGSSDSSVNSSGGGPITSPPEAANTGSEAPKATPDAVAGSTSSINPPLRGLSGAASVDANHGNGSVESFFQINNNGQTPAAGYVLPDKSTSNLLSEFNSPQPKTSAAGAPYRFLWHVMDNAGVPMFFGKSDDDLDPSLRRGYSSAVTIDSKSARTIAPNPGATNASAVYAPSKGPHKIPESELEGTDSWVKDNDQMP